MLLPRQGCMESRFKSFMIMVIFKVGVMVKIEVMFKV